MLDARDDSLVVFVQQSHSRVFPKSGSSIGLPFWPNRNLSSIVPVNDKERTSTDAPVNTLGSTEIKTAAKALRNRTQEALSITMPFKNNSVNLHQKIVDGVIFLRNFNS